MVANENIEKPIFGFSVKNLDATQLFGSNTVRRKYEVNRMKKGESRKVSWTIPNVFNEGQYFVDVTVARVPCASRISAAE